MEFQVEDSSGDHCWCDRNWADSELEGKILQLLLQMPRNEKGEWNVEIARELGFIVTEFPADWKKNMVGPIRNKEMLNYICEQINGADLRLRAVYLFHKQITC